MSTRSPMVSGKPASATIMSPRLDSPLPIADGSRFFWPTLPPTTVARTTNRIQPMTAVLRCVALHRPTRAAKLRGCMGLLGKGLAGRTGPDSQRPGRAPMQGCRCPVVGKRRPCGAATSPAKCGIAPIRGDARLSAVLRAEVGQDGEHAAMALGVPRQVELPEDARDVPLQRGVADVEGTGDRGVGVSLGHPRERGALRRRQPVDRATGRPALEHLGDDLRVERGPAVRDLSHRVDEGRGVRDALLEEVADARGAVAEQPQRVALVDELGEHHDPGAGQLGADPQRRADAVVGVGRRHPDVGHGDVGPVLAGLLEELVGVARLPHHGEPSALEDAHDAGAHQERVLRHDHAERRGARTAHEQGSSARSRVPRPGGLETTSVPLSAATRSESPRSPEPPAALAPPTPSSLTSTSSRPSTRSTRTVAWPAWAYFATLVRASETTKYAAVSTAAGRRPVGPPTMSTGTVARAASARTAG